MTTYEGFATLEREGWSDDAVAAGYVDLFSSACDLAIPRIVASVASGSRVLDLCCGHGNVFEALHAAGHSVVGVDFSPAMVARARARLPAGDFVEADAQDLPFPDRDFDAVVCSFGMMHVPDQPRALAQVKRVLRPGGLFMLTAWCGPDVSPAFQVVYGCIQTHGDPGVKLPASPNFHQFADEAIARRLLADAGLALERSEKIDCYWSLSSPEQFAEIIERGTPRAGYLLRQQPAQNGVAIRSAMAEAVRKRFERGDRWHVPIPAVLITARATG